MITHKNGFTLLELLIAAALIGVLALFATQAYRGSASDIRVENAKAYVRLLLSASQNCLVEYPGSEDCLDETKLRRNGFLESRVADLNASVTVTIEGTTEKPQVCYKGEGRVTDEDKYCTEDGESFTKVNN